MTQMKIALVGNPNVGKSTVFNYLTGANQQVGNWPGKTVEHKQGKAVSGETEVELVDLPGTYSLTAYSQEEIVTRQYILRNKPDAVMVVVDASNIERNLYLVLQILELTSRVVLGLNMMDLADSLGMRIDEARLSGILGIPVVKIVAAKGQGVKEFLAQAVKVGHRPESSLRDIVQYPPELAAKIELMEKALRGAELEGYPLRWLALKRLEGDGEIGQEWLASIPETRAAVRKDSCCDTGTGVVYQLQRTIALPGEELLARFRAEGWGAEHFEIALTDAKYKYIAGILPQFLERRELNKPAWTERLDHYALSPLWGYPILLAVVVVVFWLSFIASAPLGDLVSVAMAWAGGLIANGLQAWGVPEIWQSLVRDGIFGGVGAVLAFVPQIAIFFAFFSFLQDSGYLARAAFLGDRFMQLLGLHGKSFFSIVSSYGCNVPGIMATRTLEDPKDRLITMLLNPLIPCVPRLGVMSAVVAAFFPGLRGTVAMLGLLFLSLAMVALSALFLRRVVNQSQSSAFVMELPLYHMPTPVNVLLPTWSKTFSFLKRAWTFILGASIIVWTLSAFPLGSAINQSWAADLGRTLVFIGRPLGFDWRIMLAILFGFTAKETTLSTLGILYGVTSNVSLSIAQAMRSAVTPLTAFTFLVVYMLYVPCLAAVITTFKESRSWGWTLFGVCYNLLLSFLAGWLVFNGGRLLGFV